MKIKICFISILSLTSLSLQDTTLKSRIPSQLTNEANINNDNSIVVDAINSTTKIVSGDKINSLVDGPNEIGTVQQNDVAIVQSSLFSASGSCVCVPYYLCNENKTVIVDGASIIDIRFKPPSCENYLDVCCNAPLDHIEMQNKFTTDTISCGRRNFQGAGVRIKGDVNNEAQFGEFPWMIAVLKIEQINENISMSIYQCGGSLIHPQVVMTAAHCVVNQDMTTMRVRAGEWDTQTKNERFPHVDQRITRVIIHEGFYSGGLFNDIALMIAENPFSLSEHINTVCLPPQGLIPNDVTCTASGWGKNEFGKKGWYQVILKKVDLPIVPHNTCEKQLKSTRLGRYFRLHESFICAGGEAGRDTCKGDGGGPLVCPIIDPNHRQNFETRYYQSGIIAWGISCAEENIPGVYVNVALFRNWIDNWMKQLNFQTKYYMATS